MPDASAGATAGATFIGNTAASTPVQVGGTFAPSAFNQGYTAGATVGAGGGFTSDSGDLANGRYRR